MSPTPGYPAPEVYERAAKLLGPNLVGLVRNAAVVPHWVGSSDTFWYDRELEDGRAFVLVDATNGARRDAFDHDGLAKTLSRELGLDTSRAHLPFDHLELDPGGGISFDIEGQRYGFSTAGDLALLEARPADRSDLLPAPDGERGIACRDGDLWLIELTTGEERRLTTDGSGDAGYGIHPDGYGTNAIPRVDGPSQIPPVGAIWSPDGTRFVVPFFDQRNVEPYPFVDSVPSSGSLRPRLHQVRIPLVGEPAAAIEWFVIDVPSGARRRIELPTALLALQQDLLPIAKHRWVSEEHLYVVAHGDNMGVAYLFDVDVTSGRTRTVIEESLDPRMDLNTTTYNVPNVWISDDGSDVIWFSQRDGWGHLYMYDGVTGSLRHQLTDGEWLVRDIIKVDAAGRRIYFTGGGREGGDPYLRYLYRVSFDGADLTLLTPERADHVLMPPDRLLYAPDGMPLHDPFSRSMRFVVCTHSKISEPPRCVIRSTETADLIATVEAADASRLFAAGWRPPETFVAKASDGETDLWGVIYTPSDLDPEASYPVLDAQYASPLISVAPHNFFQAYRQDPRLNQAAFAEVGFVVVTLDGRGTTNRSKAFADAMHGRLDTCGLEDHVDTIRQLASTRPYMDLERVGIYGVSYGGYTAIRGMLEFPEFFKAGIATSPIAIMGGMYNDYHWTAFQGRPVYADGTDRRFEPAEMPENWDGLDARTAVERLAGALFLQIGELDENVLPGQLMRFVDTLVAEGKRFEMLHLPGRAHQLLSEPYVIKRNLDFMLRHLVVREPEPPAVQLHMQPEGDVA